MRDALTTTSRPGRVEYRTQKPADGIFPQGPGLTAGPQSRSRIHQGADKRPYERSFRGRREGRNLPQFTRRKGAAFGADPYYTSARTSPPAYPGWERFPRVCAMREWIRRGGSSNDNLRQTLPRLIANRSGCGSCRFCLRRPKTKNRRNARPGYEAHAQEGNEPMAGTPHDFDCRDADQRIKRFGRFSFGRGESSGSALSCSIEGL